MSKSNVSLLKEAIARGDLEAAAKLAEKIAPTPKKKSPKTPKLPKATPKATKVPAKEPKEPPKTSKKGSRTEKKTSKITKPTPQQSAKQNALYDRTDESSYIAPSRPKKNHQGREFVGEDGRKHRTCRNVSMEGVEFTNKFNPKEYDVRLPARHEKADAKLRKKKPTVSSRPPAEKVRVKCKECGDMCEVYGWECEGVDGKRNFKCNSCIPN